LLEVSTSTVRPSRFSAAINALTKSPVATASFGADRHRLPVPRNVRPARPVGFRNAMPPISIAAAAIRSRRGERERERAFLPVRGRPTSSFGWRNGIIKADQREKDKITAVKRKKERRTTDGRDLPRVYTWRFEYEIKSMSLKAVRVQRPREPHCPKEAPAVKACEEQEKEWVAEPEAGVLITLVSLPDGGNIIKKIRFSQKMFDDLGAQRWWSENYDKIMELYSVGPGHSSPTPPPSDNEVSLPSAESSFDVPEKTTRWHHEVKHKLKSFTSSCIGKPTADSVGAEESIVPLRSSGSSAASSSNAEEPATTEAAVEIQDKVLEWVVEDEPGVFVTLRSTPSGSREILRVEFR
ncbi:hypothetical protein BHE74_00000537, partial [Ensete ventricosum]